MHIELWHVAFNLYWLWALGSRLEQAIGPLPYLVFILLSAFISSSFELAVSGTTGIGASGFIYALFGFMWRTRHLYPHFMEVLNLQTIQLFLIWLVGCVVATQLQILNVGNAAHFSGLLFGVAVANAFVLRRKSRLAWSELITFAVLSIIPLFWCPWSVTWLSYKAYSAHVARKYELAIERYTQVLRLDPGNAWAHLNRSYAYEVLGQPEMAQADLQKAREINPAIEETP